MGAKAPQSNLSSLDNESPNFNITYLGKYTKLGLSLSVDNKKQRIVAKC